MCALVFMLFHQHLDLVDLISDHHIHGHPWNRNFKQFISKINWNNTQNLMPDDVNEEVSTFHEKVSKCVRNHVPLTKLSRTKI